MMSNAKRRMMLLLVLGGSGCRQDMHDQARVDPYEESPLDEHTAADFLPPAGTVARGSLAAGSVALTGYDGGRMTTVLPYHLTAPMLARGQERYEIFCAPCHGLDGHGQGPVATRGFFPMVADLQQDRLRAAAVGYLFGIITNGFNAMPSYAAQIPIADRWAIIAYLRALQASQHADPAAIPAAIRTRLEQGGAQHAP